MIEDLLGGIGGFFSGTWLANNMTSKKVNWKTRLANLIWAGAMFYFTFIIYDVWKGYPDYQNLALLVAWAMLVIEGVKGITTAAQFKFRAKNMKIFDWIRYELLGLPRPRKGNLQRVNFYSGGKTVKFYKRKVERK